MSRARRERIHRAMPPPPPSLRTDLQLHEHGELVRVISPATGREHFLRAVEWRVAREMDGRRPLPELERRAQHLGVPATAANLESFVRELEARGLLAPRPAPAQLLPDRPRFSLRGWPEEKQRRVEAALLALKEERYAEAHRLLEQELRQAPDCEELRAFAEGVRRAEVDATSEQDEQWALAEMVRVEGDGLVLATPLPLPRDADAGPPARSPRWHVPVLLAAAAVLALGLPFPYRLSGDCVLAAADRATVRATVAGRLERIAAKDGDPVRKGDLLVQLGDPDLGARYEEARARRAQAELALQQLQSGPTSQQLDRARAAVARAAAQTQALQVDAQRLEHAAADGHGSAAELAKARRLLDGARWEERSTQAALGLLEAGATAEALAQRRAELEEARALEAALAQRLEAGAIRAPRDGVLQATDLHLRAGAWVKPGEPLAEIQGRRSFRVEGRLSELDAEGLAPGLPFRVRLAGGAGVVLSGRVEALGERFEPRAGETAAVRVRGMVEDTSGSARDGMSGRLEVERGRAPLARILLRRVRHFLAAHWP